MMVAIDSTRSTGMNLRSKFFKKPWQHRDSATRLRAVREGEDAELKAELPRLAQFDESAEVRLAALQRLNSEPFWLDARLRETEAEIIQAADHYLAREILRSERPDLESARLEWLALISDYELLRRIASASPAMALRRAALARIPAQGFLGDCYINEKDDALAAELLPRIDQTSTLERIVQQARKRSKQRAQAAAERLETLRIAAGQAVPGQTASERLVQAAEALARGQLSGDLARQFADLKRDWDSSSEHPEPLALRFQGAVKIIEATLRRRNEEPAAKAPPPADAAPVEADQPPAAHAELSAAADFIRTTIRKGSGADVRELLAHWDRVWNKLRQPSPADEALKRDMLPMLRELQAQVQMQSQTKTATPTQGDSTAPEKVSFQVQLDQIAEHLESGDLSAAQENIRALRSEFDRLPRRQRLPADGGRLQRMEGRLREMRNWQHWSNNKIRDELIEQMERLPDSGQHPDAIMAALKKARAEWKRLEALEVLPGDKRRFAAPPGQWRQFQAACKKAFEAGKPYFEKRDRLLQDNLDTLLAFVQAGHEAAQRESADTSELLGFLRKARQAIRRMDDLPAKKRGESAAALRELMNVLSKRLDECFEAVESSKRRLVAEARALSHEKDLQTAIDKAKALQSQWQKAGSGRRKVEQQLWQAFREPIDPLFEKLKSDQDQRRQVEQSARAELQALCDQAEALAELAEPELEHARGRMLGLIDEWLTQEGRPESLNRRFERAEQRLEQRLQKFRQQQKRGEQEALGSLAEQIQQLWNQRCQGHGGDLSEHLAAGPDHGQGGAALVALARKIAAPEFEPDTMQARVQQNLQAARQIAVEMEFLSGLDTPEADQSLRMDYQVQRLARRMSEREQQPDLATELQQLKTRWYQSLPLPPTQYAELASRVKKAQDILRGMAGL